MMQSRKEARRLDRAVVALESMAATPATRNSARPAVGPPPIMCRARILFSVSEKKSHAATIARRATPIHAYVGPNGGGKSLAMVADTIPTLARGRRVLSTVALLDHRTGEPHPCYERFYDWDQLLEARDCDVLMDEMVGIASARDSQSLPVQVQNILVQLRRRNVVLRWSAPNFARADKIVREVTQGVTECRGYFADRSAIKTAQLDDGVQLWAPKRLFAFRTYDTVDFEEWTTGKRDKADPEVVQWFYGPGSTVFGSYDTLDSVSMVGDPDAAGICAACGGHRPRKKCECDRLEQHDHGDELAGRRGRRAAPVPADLPPAEIPY